MEICDKAQELVQQRTKEQNESIYSLLEICGSPVEQILLASLCDYWDGRVHLGYKRLQCHLASNYPDWDGIFLMCVEPQKTLRVPLGDDSYRVDFYIYLTRFRHSGTDRNTCWPELGRLVIEVDGHDFHDRTKQQASYDRRRDRELTLEGYRVIRYTGADVYNHPYECAEDIDFHINDIASSIFDDYRRRGKLEELIVG